MRAGERDDIPAVAPHLPAVFHDDTTVITVQNGIPWWYFQLHGSTFDGYRLSSLDPDGAIEENIDPGRIVACVCYPAAEVVEPGVVRHVEGRRIPVGELGRLTEPMTPTIGAVYGCAKLLNEKIIRGR